MSGLYEAARALEARGWFKPNGCADKATARDMANMRRAIAAETKRRRENFDAISRPTSPPK